MAKKDGAKKDGAKKTKPGKPEKRIPKSIAGVTLPKDLRRAGDAMLAKAATPEGKAMIAGGLSMAAAAIATVADRQRSAGKPAAAPKTAAPDPAATDAAAAPAGGVRDPQAVVDAIGGAVEAAIGRFFAKPR